MSKRIRRDRRTIWVDSDKTAKNIERFCLENNFVEGEFTKAYTTCYAVNLGDKFNPKWAVIFQCTLDEWNRIADHYNLVRLKRYKHTFDYELGLSI